MGTTTNVHVPNTIIDSKTGNASNPFPHSTVLHPYDATAHQHCPLPYGSHVIVSMHPCPLPYSSHVIVQGVLLFR